MRQKGRLSILLYAISDFFAAQLAWICLYLFRKVGIEGLPFRPDILVQDTNFLLGILIIPSAWVLFYFITGTYRDVYRKSRLAELGKTIWQSIIGCIIIFFALLLDDLVLSYQDYYQSVAVLLGSHFTLSFFTRLYWLNRAKRQIERGTVAYNTLIIGSNTKATKLYKEITNRKEHLGYRFLGFVEVTGDLANGLKHYISKLGHMDELPRLLQEHQIEEVIIAIETSEHDKLQSIINTLADSPVVIKIIPDIYDILSGSVKMSHVIGAVLIEIYPDLMPHWQKVFKRGLDISVSALALFILSPFLAYIAWRVKASSEGSVFYRQQRIGLHGKRFDIIKFRSMYSNAEATGPQLSSQGDTRITPWGRIMRKYRFDELPQFWNVLIGEMSLVGPRPERQHFIDQIITQAPHYKHLNKVKPGITSLGMVKYGYAENVTQMVERLQFDILYIENMSLAMDFKILIYTVLTLIQGKGQ